MTPQVPPSVAVVGGSGFVGSAVSSALHRRGAAPRLVRAPRLSAPQPMDAHELPLAYSDALGELRASLAGCQVAINCAGDPDAGSRDAARLYGANGVLPGLIGLAAADLGMSRYIHVSSAVVQGRAAQLDDSFSVDGFSAYSRSKILGERMALELGPVETCVYRPPSVHAASRKVSRLTTRIASSPLASVAAPGSGNSPQAHIDNVGDIVAFLALVEEVPPHVVHHPSEGFTSTSLMELLGDRRPVVIPRPLARMLVRGGEFAGRAVPALAANARRVEMLWFGQGQAPSWATSHGWTPVATQAEWESLAQRLRLQTDAPRGHH